MVQNHFAEIILPLSLPGTFTYEAPEGMLPLLKTGQRVSVPFGSNKLYTGIIREIHKRKPELHKTKKIDSLLDTEPLVTELQLKFWEWLAEYYMCTPGDVYRNAFPAALKLESETFIKPTGARMSEDAELSEDEFAVLRLLSAKGLISIKEISEVIPPAHTLKVIKSLWEQGYLMLDEVLKNKYKPKIQSFVRLNPELKKEEERMKNAMEELKNAHRQREFLLQLVVEEARSPKPIRVSAFIKKNGGSHATLKAMEEKGLVEIYEKNVSRIEMVSVDTEETEQLTFEQENAVKSIQKYFGENKTVLLHGVTSSGKTEIYIKLIEEKIKEGRTTLFLLPDISITSQMLGRIRKYFGETVGIYHSKFNQNERAELWIKALNGDYKIIIGPRSALFLPFPNLGLVVVDEEQDDAFKQHEPKPYYNARDMAVVLAGMHKADVIMGSATPSLESYHNALTGKYGYVELTERYSDSALPKIELVDLKKAMRQKEMLGDISVELEKAVLATVKEGKQVLIFQNRRGYAPIVECLKCGFSPHCPNCDVPLTFHKYSNQLKCHYCGHAQSVPTRCPNCQSTDLTTKGLGTEQIENQLQQVFPKLKVARMDVDTMRRKHAYEKILEAFEYQEIDIVVGTRIIAKGLDFSNVGLVGVIRADSLLNYPDFRAHEKAFQLLTQVAGRAGRREEQGRVLIQTFNPNHEVLQDVSRYDYKKMAEQILYERKSYLYPPYIRLIRFTFRHAKHERVEKTAREFAKLLSPYFDDKHLLGPEEPSIARIRNQYIRHLLLKIPKDKSPSAVKQLAEKAIQTLHTIPAFRSVKLDVDVDPL